MNKKRAVSETLYQTSEQLLDALIANKNKGLTRSDLAAMFRMKRLNVKEQVLLEILVELGLVNKIARQSNVPHVLVYEYQIHPDLAALDQEHIKWVYKLVELPDMKTVKGLLYTMEKAVSRLENRSTGGKRLWLQDVMAAIHDALDYIAVWNEDEGRG